MSLLRKLLFVLLALAAMPVAAQTFPPLTGRVVDAAKLLSPEQVSQLDQLSAQVEQASSRQLVVATIPDLQGYPIEDYGYRLGRAWKIGQKDANNGIILIVAPNERKVRIEVGYGLEGTLTDALSSVIISSAIIPRFKTKDFSGGIERGVDGIIDVLSGDSAEWQPKINVRSESKAEDFDKLFPILFTAFLIFFIWYLIRHSGDGRPPGPGSRRGPIIFPGGWGSSDWGGGGGGGFSGGFGGGFSGGGGSSGGAGASGSW